MDPREAQQLLSRSYADLTSQYRLKYSSLLRLLRAEGASAAAVLSRTLASWQIERRRSREEAERARVREGLTAATSRMHELAAAGGTMNGHAGNGGHGNGSVELVQIAEQYLSARISLHRLGEAFGARVRQHTRPWLQPGRVVQFGPKAGWDGYGVLVSLRGGGRAARKAGKDGCIPSTRHLVTFTVWRS